MSRILADNLSGFSNSREEWRKFCVPTAHLERRK
jgi:hypothetical protein